MKNLFKYIYEQGGSQRRQFFDIEIELLAQNYPDYSRSSHIARIDDLSKVFFGEAEPDSCAATILSDEYNGDDKDPQILDDLCECEGVALLAALDNVGDNATEAELAPLYELHDFLSVTLFPANAERYKLLQKIETITTTKEIS